MLSNNNNLNPCKPGESQKEVLLDLVSVSSSTNSQLFPKHCFVCKKDRIQHNKKDEYPHLIKTNIGEVSIKLAAKEKMPSFYYENKDEDLIARELKCHRSCYNKFRLSSVGFDDISDNADFREYQ